MYLPVTSKWDLMHRSWKQMAACLWLHNKHRLLTSFTITGTPGPRARGSTRDEMPWKSSTLLESADTQWLTFRLILPRKELGDKSMVPSFVCSIWAATLLARLFVRRRGCTCQSTFKLLSYKSHRLKTHTHHCIGTILQKSHKLEQTFNTLNSCCIFNFLF